MSLVIYSSSSDSDHPPPKAHGTISTKRKRPSPPPTPPSSSKSATLPPLPPSFHNHYTTALRSSINDDPTLHNGRHRQTPHVEGNWPSHVYIECLQERGVPDPETYTQLQRLVNSVSQSRSRVTAADDNGEALPDAQNDDLGAGAKDAVVHTLLTTPLGATLPLHISLSRPLVLKGEQRRGFVDALSRRIGLAGEWMGPFMLRTSGLGWHPNADHTRWFLVLRLLQRDRDSVSVPRKEGRLLGLLKAANETAREFGLGVLYEDDDDADAESLGMGRKGKKVKLDDGDEKPKREKDNEKEDMVEACHISIAWSLTAPPATAADQLKDISADNTALEISVSEVKVKMGNGISVIPLDGKRDCGNGIVER